MKRLLLPLLLAASAFGSTYTIVDAPGCVFSPKGSFTLPSTGAWFNAYFSTKSGSVTLNGVPLRYNGVSYFIPPSTNDVLVTFELGKSAFLDGSLRCASYQCDGSWQAVRLCCGADFPEGCTDFLFPFDADGLVITAGGGPVQVCQTNQFEVSVPTLHGSVSVTLAPFTIAPGGVLRLSSRVPRLMFKGASGSTISIAGAKNE